MALPITLPASLERLPELARNLWWTWHPQARALFAFSARRMVKEYVERLDPMALT
jgi:hypothetical protein